MYLKMLELNIVTDQKVNNDIILYTITPMLQLGKAALTEIYTFDVFNKKYWNIHNPRNPRITSLWTQCAIDTV